MKGKLGAVLAMLLLASSPAFAQTETERFDIGRFQVEGNTLLPETEVNSIVAPFTGPRRVYGDVQRALEALELRYRELGFSAVQVYVPEQELDRGVVTLKVIESKVGKVYVNEAKFFNDANVRASLPALKEGVSPNAVAISQGVQLANENPAKQADVVLRVGEAEGTVDVDVNVKDSSPRKIYVTLDNTGNSQTGYARLGVGAQHANLFGRDHVGTFNYITSPDKQSDVRIFSASYRIPLYSLGDSLDFIAARSNVNAGTSATVAGPLSFSGSGDVFAFRYNQLLRRRGEFSHRLIYGLDYKAFDNTCSLGSFGPAGCGNAGVNITSRPVSITYSGGWQNPTRQSDFYIGVARNVPGGKNGSSADFAAAQPSPTGGAGAPADFLVFKLGGSVTGVLGDWQYRVALSAQWTDDRLIAAEQLGIAGSGTVRGFLEREVARDVGYFGNFELYTPNIAERLGLKDGNLRALLFHDRGFGNNNPLAGEDKQKVTLANVGAGVRMNLDKSLALRFDVARVLAAGPTTRDGDYRIHASLYFGF